MGDGLIIAHTDCRDIVKAVNTNDFFNQIGTAFDITAP